MGGTHCDSTLGREEKTRKLSVQGCAQPKNDGISEQILILFYMWAEPSVTAAYLGSEAESDKRRNYFCRRIQQCI